MNNKGLIDIKFDKSTNWILVGLGFFVGFSGFSAIVALFSYITNVVSGWAETKAAVYLTKAQENVTGAVVFLIGGIAAVKLFAWFLTFVFGFVLGLGLRFILYNHLGWIPNPDIGAHFGMDALKELQTNQTNQTLNQTLNQTVNQTI